MNGFNILSIHTFVAISLLFLFVVYSFSVSMLDYIRRAIEIVPSALWVCARVHHSHPEGSVLIAPIQPVNKHNNFLKYIFNHSNSICVLLWNNNSIPNYNQRLMMATFHPILKLTQFSYNPKSISNWMNCICIYDSKVLGTSKYFAKINIRGWEFSCVFWSIVKHIAYYFFFILSGDLCVYVRASVFIGKIMNIHHST